MKKSIRFAFILFAVIAATSLHANWLEDIFKSELRLEGLQHGIMDKQGQMLSIERNSLNIQKDIDSLMKQVNEHLTGSSGWGTYQYHDYQSYGDNARDWNRLMRMAESGSGDGRLGQVMGDLSRQYPVSRETYNKGITDIRSRHYYALKSQTVLAARAASQLDYDRIQEQIAYQQMLQQQIEKTRDLKAAVDLLNRLQVENNLIQLEILRQAALVNQQQAVNEQASINTALSNARFLSR